MNTQLKKIREYFLIACGIVLAIGVVWLSAYLIIFLTRALNTSLTFERKGIRANEFDTQGFEQLNLMQEQRTGSIPKPVVQKTVIPLETSTSSGTTTPGVIPNP